MLCSNPANMPAPILAELLGTTDKNAANCARLAARGGTGYIADRAMIAPRDAAAADADRRRHRLAAEVLDQSPREVDRCVDLNSTNRNALDVDAKGDSQAPAV